MHIACKISRGSTPRSRPIEAGKRYQVASRAPVAERASGGPVWDVVSGYLRVKKLARPLKPGRPELSGAQGNPGLS